MNKSDLDTNAGNARVGEEELKRALENINNYLEREFEQSLSEDDDLHHIPMGYTTLGDNEEHDIQIEADLIDCSIRYIIDGKEAKTEEYGSLEEMNELVLSVVDFDELVGEGSDLISQFDITQGIWGVEDPYITYSSDEKGASVEFLVTADDNTYEELAKRTPLIAESDYDSFDDLMKSDDYLNIYATVRENGAAEVTIGISGGGELYPAALSGQEQEALRAFISRCCDEHMDKSLDDMLAEAKEDESLLEPVYGKKFAEAVAEKPAGFGNHGELYEDSSREQKERYMAQGKKSTNKDRDFER